MVSSVDQSQAFVGAEVVGVVLDFGVLSGREPPELGHRHVVAVKDDHGTLVVVLVAVVGGAEHGDHLEYRKHQIQPLFFHETPPI